jgi:hypothetical protein
VAVQSHLTWRVSYKHTGKPIQQALGVASTEGRRLWMSSYGPASLVPFDDPIDEKEDDLLRRFPDTSAR